MKKEIGGYLELEEPAGQEYYPDLRRESRKNSAFVADGSTQVQKDLPAIFSLRFRNRCL